MNILISGGSGFIGSALTRSLLEDGHKVWIMTRNPARTRLPEGAQPVRWDGRTSQGWIGIFSQMDAVINLAGETIGKWPWTEKRKKLIHDSRMETGRAISDAFQKADKRPPVLIQASGIGYYGPCGSETVAEDSPVGNDFMASVAASWEASTRIVDTLGVRRVIIRSALVLNAQKGVLPLMALPIRLGFGGRLGNGKQGVSWIHIDDEVRAIRYLLENDKARGAFNLSAPNPVSNADFNRTLAQVLSRPYWLPVPAFALKLALGGMSTLLLDGQYVIPQRLVNLGFIFRFETVGEAFRNLF
jgi:uncharacterized protein (TIGR01777 family)